MTDHVEFAPYLPVPWYIRTTSLARSLVWVTFISDCPLTWFWQKGRRNPKADMEGTYSHLYHYTADVHRGYSLFFLTTGPVYMIGPPDRQLESGKAVLATVNELKGK